MPSRADKITDTYFKSDIKTLQGLIASREIVLLMHDTVTRMNCYLMTNQYSICVFLRLQNKLNLSSDCGLWVSPWRDCIALCSASRTKDGKSLNKHRLNLGNATSSISVE